MDTSAEYIKMCGKAEEIQSFFKGMGDEGEVIFDGEEEEIFIFGTSSDWFPDKNDCIWLPRQDELQEMVKLVGFNSYWHVHQLQKFVDEDNAGGLCGNPSMEQIWLAFVMKQKYNKTWTGETWVPA